LRASGYETFAYLATLGRSAGIVGGTVYAAARAAAYVYGRSCLASLTYAHQYAHPQSRTDGDAACSV
jgi:hypothetical protein